MIKFIGNVGNDSVVIVMEKLSRKDLLFHLSLNNRKPEKFFATMIDKYFSSIVQNGKYQGETKNGQKFTVEVSKL